ncbi:MAG: GreA/GreB family elongation factor [Patescibacteria group bacterium]
MYKFLRPDLDELLRKQAAIFTELKERGQDMGEANRQSSETWHDNAPLEVVQREFERLQRRYVELGVVIQQAQVIIPSEMASQVVSIGSVVTFTDQDNQEKTLKIGSYMPSDASGAISYEAPVAKLLIDNEVGDIVEGRIVGREVEYKILKIERWV